MVSVIIVNYKVEKELIACISSIVSSKPKVEFEIIVVDNGSENDLEEKLKKFYQVKYIKSPGNIGFGAGNNLGAKLAKGDFLFFLNPDTIVGKNSIDVLFNFVKNKPKSGMVAPLLLDPSGNVYPSQGSSEYDLKNAIVTSSFINKLFPNNPISRKFFHKDWPKKNTEEFDVVPGTAFMIRRDLFEKVGMFDDKLFLYFEEYDLAKRIKKIGYKNYIIPQSKVTHIWEASTKRRKDINRIFASSRYYFFKKHYGIFFASIVNVVSGFGKYEFMLGLIIASSIFLGLFRIRELMTFIGDQGWFYLSARDMLMSGQIPLVGIASSHPWLHQGSFWTYLLALFLWLFNFNPVSGAYLTIILGVFSVVGIYIVGSAFFSKRVGLIASLLYATSPLVVYYVRLPYHTSPIPFFVLIYIFCLIKATQNKLIYLPATLLLISILYNFEIATVILGVVLAVVLAGKLLKKEISVKEVLNKKFLILSFIAFTAPLLPMILYDVKNGFPQTLKFVAWVSYRAVSLLVYNPQQAFSANKIIEMFNFLSINFTKLIFASSAIFSFVVFILVMGWVIYMLLRGKTNGYYNLIFLLFFIPLILVFFNQTSSDAYLPVFFPIAILLFSLCLDFIMSKKLMFVPVIIFVIILSAGNINFMLKNNFAFDQSSNLFTLTKRIQASKQILNIARRTDYNLRGIGRGSEFESFTMNYEYLTWWLGHGPSKNSKNLKIYVSESASGIKLQKIINKE